MPTIWIHDTINKGECHVIWSSEYYCSIMKKFHYRVFCYNWTAAEDIFIRQLLILLYPSPKYVFICMVSIMKKFSCHRLRCLITKPIFLYPNGEHLDFSCHKRSWEGSVLSYNSFLWKRARQQPICPPILLTTTVQIFFQKFWICY